MVNKKESSFNKKTKDSLLLIGTLIALILVNFIGSKVFTRIDFTTEKRYSLTNATTNQLENLEDIVFVRVYLEGDLPPDYKRLRDATKELLDEFRAYSPGNIEYEFINPSENPEEKARIEVYKNLTKQGLQYNNIKYKDGDTYSEKIIFPGAIFSYQGKETPVQLLKSQMGVNEQVMLNNSIQQLEYEFSTAIKKLTRHKPKSIAFITGHGELDEYKTADIGKTLSDFYVIDRVKINGRLDALKLFDAIVIAQPDSLFSEKDKFIIDQFIMKGGKAIWLVDPVLASMDSLRTQTTTMGVPQDVNIADMLFKYGVRLNSDLIQDLQSLPIPIITGYVGNQPKQEFFPWLYFPMLMPSSNHPIVKNLEAIKTEFVSSIDTINTPNIKKTILLESSPYTKLVRTPVRISFNMLRDEPDRRQFAKGPQPVAVLLEGEFTSNFKNRIPTQITNNPDIAFKDLSTPNKMVVISDGDIIKNDYKPSTDQFSALGYDKYTNRVYGNKDFLLNTFNYLLDDSGLIDSRSKEFKIRLLDPEKSKIQKEKYQIINTVLPVILIVFLGLLQFISRKRKYGKIKK